MNSDLLAEELCERLLVLPDSPDREELLRETDDLPDCVPYLLQSARERMSSDAEGALNRARLGVALANRGTDERGKAQAWRLVGQVCRVQGDHATAITALESAAACTRPAGTRPPAAASGTQE